MWPPLVTIALWVSRTEPQSCPCPSPQHEWCLLGSGTTTMGFLYVHHCTVLCGWTCHTEVNRSTVGMPGRAPQRLRRLCSHLAAAPSPQSPFRKVLIANRLAPPLRPCPSFCARMLHCHALEGLNLAEGASLCHCDGSEQSTDVHGYAVLCAEARLLFGSAGRPGSSGLRALECTLTAMLVHFTLGSATLRTVCRRTPTPQVSSLSRPSSM